MDSAKKRGRPILYARRRLNKTQVKLCIDIPKAKIGKREFQEASTPKDEPAPLKHQNAFYFPPPPPPPPPPSPNGPDLETKFDAFKQQKLPFKFSINELKYGLSQLSLYLCAFCIKESSERICVRYKDQTFLNLRLCNQCFECNANMQSAASDIWKKYWEEKAKAVFILKQQHEKENEENEKKKRLEAYGLSDV